MSIIPGSIVSTFNCFLNCGERSSEEISLEQVRNSFNKANHYLNSQMNNLQHKSFKGALQESDWVSLICTTAESVFNSYFGDRDVDDSDYVSLEAKALYQTLNCRSNFVTEKQRSTLLAMLCEGEVAKDSVGYVDSAILVFSYALENPAWKKAHLDQLSKIYKFIESYIEQTDDPDGPLHIMTSLAGEVLPSTTHTLSIIVEGVVFKVDRMKAFLSSEFLKKLVLGSFREKGKSSFTLHGVDQSSFEYFLQYVESQNSQCLDRLDIESLIKLNSCCSQLMASDEVRQGVIEKIDEKVSDMTIRYNTDHLLELKFQDPHLSEDALLFVSDAVVQQETGVIDLRSIENVSDQDLKLLFDKFSNIKTLYLNFDCDLSPSGWLILTDIARINQLHLDFQNKSFSGIETAESVQALKDVAAMHRQNHFNFNVHIEKAGKLPVDLLLDFAKAIPDNIVKLDITASSLTDKELSEILEKLSSLEALKLDYCKKLNGSDFLQVIGENCPGVKEISLCQSSKLKESLLNQFLDTAQFLTKVNVAWHHYLSDDFVLQLAKNCKRLQEADFTNLRNVSDRALKSLAEKCQQLKQVKLDFCQSLTNKTLRDLNKHAPNLQQLSIHQIFQRRSPLSLETLNSLMKSKSSSFELVINKSNSNITSVVALASKYPLVTVTVK